MKIELKRVSLAVAAALLASSSFAQSFTPAVIYDQAGKFDKSFNEAAYNGAERFKKDFHVDYHDAQISSDAQKEQLLRNLARNHSDLIVAVGFSYTQAVETVAKEFPKVKFTIIDSVAKGPNVQSILFREQEGSFLVGMAAAMKSKSGKGAKKYSIGVDSNQNYLFPGSVLTSMVKRVDNAVYQAFKSAKNGTWKPDVEVMGLKDNGVDWALDANNRKLITPDMEKRINLARQEIISGKIKVVDYRSNNSCPVQ